MVSSTVISPIKSLLIIFFEPLSLDIVYKAMVGPKYFGQDLINYMWHIRVIICSIFFTGAIVSPLLSPSLEESCVFGQLPNAWIEPVVVQVFKCIFSCFMTVQHICIHNIFYMSIGDRKRLNKTIFTCQYQNKCIFDRGQDE
ncbi:hypothetical protein PVAP13_3KG443100 [Panicum virgatum]|uniref:Uncharacterized protein n=1 Tax=Panicum virgatum TaxID=38727 RepID=A0A8T0V5E6_PANVG|nr:hypothetical protein PVAP13_3KG443100 [Panicum virgatum]